MSSWINLTDQEKSTAQDNNNEDPNVDKHFFVLLDNDTIESF